MGTLGSPLYGISPPSHHAAGGYTIAGPGQWKSAESGSTRQLASKFPKWLDELPITLGRRLPRVWYLAHMGSVQYSGSPPASWTRTSMLSMLSSMDASSRANGHQVIAVWCNRCGHQAKVSPELWTRAKRRHCRMCGSRDYSHRWVWVGSTPPDNVVPISRGQRQRT